MMKDLLNRIAASDILLEVMDGKLKLFTNNPDIDPDLIDEIKAKKKELIQILSNNEESEASGISSTPIPNIPIAAHYPLSSSQRRLWVLSQLKDGSISYNMPGIYEFKGNLDTKILNAAFQKLIKRHEILRTVFREDEHGEIRQFIQSTETTNFSIKIEDCRTDKGPQKKIAKLIKEDCSAAFDLENGPLLRGRLFQRADDDFVFCYVMHHIISDGWSIEIILRELMLFYNAYKKGEEEPIEALRIQYKDYTVWQQNQLSESAIAPHKNYWLKQFEGELPILSHIGDKARPAFKTYNGASMARTIDPALSNRLKQFSQKEGGTLFMGLLATVNVLLHKYTGQTDLIIGSPIAGREHLDLRDQIGFYVNILALRTRFEKEHSFRELFSLVKELTLSAYEHQAYPFDELVDTLDLNRDMSRNALFDVMLMFQNKDQQNIEHAFDELQIKVVEDDTPISRFDLQFDFAELTDTLQIGISYNTDIFTAPTITRLLNHLELLLHTIIDSPDVAIHSLEFIDNKEKQLLASFNKTEFAYANNKTVLDFLGQHVSNSPEHIALAIENKNYTYQQLNQAANQLSNYLIDHKKIQPNDLVGIKLERNEWLIISILAIMKSGAAYVPIDLNFPEDRISYIQKDSNYKLLIDHTLVEGYKKEQDNMGIKNPKNLVNPSTIAYVIYTSGTTGNPKAVIITQANLISFFANQNSNFAFSGLNKIAATTNYTFDISILEILGSLTAGKSMHLFSDEVLLDPARFMEQLKQDSIQWLQVTPSRLAQLYESKIPFPESLQALLVGGEALTEKLYEQLKKEKFESINVYGPTETTIWSSSSNIKESDYLTIGQPLANEEIYILNPENKLQPIGVAGELCISGDGVAQGYLNRPELTASKFIKHPFRKKGLLYKTGDLAKWLPDGNIEFLGRVDHQVKIRGYRIELGEIENVLMAISDINAAVVVAKKNEANELDLVAYLVSDQAMDITDIRTQLAKKLPNYMIPVHYVQLAALPLSANGKLDRKNLPDPQGISITSKIEYLAPRNQVEEELVTIWEKLLGKEKIGVRDNFFELGGHSLKATRLVSQIYKHFGVKISLRAIFTNLSIEEQAKLILEGGKSGFSTIPLDKRQSSYPLSTVQRRLWFLSQFKEANNAYNISSVYVFDGGLDIDALAYAFNELISRHESLRTIFKEDEEGDIKQYILSSKDIGFELQLIDLSKTKNKKTQLKEELERESNQVFDLAQGPLLSATIYKISKNKWVFSSVIHHIISDAWSINILVKELLAFYNAKLENKAAELPELRIQYKDYTAWQAAELDTSLSAHKDYWLDQLSGDLSFIDIAGGKQRPSIKTYHGAVLHRSLSPEISTTIKSFAQKEEATPFITLLAAVKVLCYHYTHQEDIIVGSPVAGRDHLDLEDQIGFYVNTLALRTRFKKNNSFKQIIQKVKKVVLSAFEHQIYPFDDLVSALQITRDNSRNPLFEILVQYTEKSNEEITQDLGALKLSPFKEDIAPSTVFDLVLNFIESDKGLDLHFLYNPDVFESDRINQIANHLEHLLSSLLTQPDQSINSISCLTATEKKQVLVDFNAKKLRFSKKQTVLDLFKKEVEKNPSAIAVEFEGQQLSYGELDKKSNQLAHHLKKRFAVKSNDLIGIMMDKSVNMLIGIWGILKAGAAYVPIDPTYPIARKTYILEDSAIKLLLSQTTHINKLTSFAEAVFDMDSELDILKSSTAEKGLTTKPTDLAYIIYTSGSTGNPKGVLVSHANLMHSLVPRLKNYQPIKHFLLLSSISFDSSIAGLFGTLCSGGKLSLTQHMDIGDIGLIANYIIDQKISHILTVPSYYKLLLEELDNRPNALEEVTVAGETCSLSLIEKHHQTESLSNCILYNEYGPTECTVWSTVYQYDKTKPLVSTIGEAIPNTSIYILDPSEQPVPIGVVGEICIGGGGVTKGYLNQKKLTEEKFVPNPFIQETKMYKTGDIARWLPDGNIEFLGRKDNQVKVRGYRLELEAIETTLLKHDKIDEAVVLIRTNAQNDQELISYLTSDSTLNSSDLKSYLKDHLPAYAVPNIYVQLAEFPLSPNGKIDKQKLLSHSGEALGTGKPFVEPQNEIEELLLSIWQEVLSLQKISIKDNFFDLGGDSLKLTRLKSIIHKYFDVNLKLQDIYEIASLEEQAKLIERSSKMSFVSIPAIKKQAHYPLSAAQIRILALSKHDENSVTYNIGEVFMFEGKLNQEALELAYKQLIERHEILRTVFDQDENGETKQFIKSIDEFPHHIEHIDIRNESNQEERIRNLIDQKANFKFDLVNGPLLNSSLMQTKDDQWIFNYVIHHIISDGWSMEVLINELLTLYDAHIKGLDSPLKPLRIQYKDYVAWHQNILNEEGETLKNYWSQQLDGELPILNLLTDKKRPPLKTFNGAAVIKKIDKSTTKALKEICQQQEGTLYMGLLTAMKALLYRYTYQNDIIVGTPVAGRMHADLEEQIGFYINILALRTQFNETITFLEFFDQIKQTTLEAFDHQLFPFDELAETLDIQHDSSRNLLFDVLIVLQNAEIGTNSGERKMDQLTIKNYEDAKTISTKFDLTFNFNELDDEIWLNLAYNTDLFFEDTVDRLATHLVQLLESITKDPNQTLIDIDYLSDHEKHQLITGFNNKTLAYNEDEPLMEILRKQVLKTPDNIALIFEDKEYTYTELHQKSNQLAWWIRDQFNVVPEDIIGLLLNKSDSFVFALLAALKSGSAYVPIDPSYPEERIKYLIEDSQCKAVIDAAAIEKFEAVADNYPVTDLDVVVEPHNMIYMIYTSGSTGKPKGVMIEHQNILPFIANCIHAFGDKKIDIAPLVSLSFDAFEFDFFMPLVTGGKLVMLPQDIILDFEELINELEQTNTIHVPPALMEQIANYLEANNKTLHNILTICSGGDMVWPSLIEQLKGVFPNASISPVYGPTEATVFVSTITYWGKEEAENIEYSEAITIE